MNPPDPCFISDCDMRGADLRGSDFSGRSQPFLQFFPDAAPSVQCFFNRCNLEGADLRDADLSHAIFWECHLVEARYDRATRWPPDFEPQAHGARLVE